MMCMLPNESFAAIDRKIAPARPMVNGPKIVGSSWAARQEAKLWRELAAKKAAAQ